MEKSADYSSPELKLCEIHSRRPLLNTSEDFNFSTDVFIIEGEEDF